MSWKREPCRNFQRGSCRYGDQCKFLHVTSQQSKSNSFNTTPQQSKSNPFGFGTGSKSQNFGTNQQQKPNPFGFGVQSAPQKGASAFGTKYQSHSQQPFENKWIRPSNSTSSDQINAQTQHKCTDPELCKKLIADDFNNERPIWILSCYAHFRGLPCDITGDISFEELRAAAYEDARRGLPLQSIVERERNLLSSKLVEFENIIQNPYVRANSIAKPNLFLTQNSTPFQAFSFGQPANLTTLAPSISSAPQTNVFGQPNAFQAPKETFNGFQMQNQNPGQFPLQALGSSPGSNLLDLKNNFGSTQNIFLAPNSVTAQLSAIGIANNQTSVSSSESKQDNNSKDSSIWLKDKWSIKEDPFLDDRDTSSRLKWRNTITIAVYKWIRKTPNVFQKRSPHLHSVCRINHLPVFLCTSKEKLKNCCTLSEWSWCSIPKASNLHPQGLSVCTLRLVIHDTALVISFIIKVTPSPAFEIFGIFTYSSDEENQHYDSG